MYAKKKKKNDISSLFNLHLMSDLLQSRPNSFPYTVPSSLSQPPPPFHEKQKSDEITPTTVTESINGSAFVLGFRPKSRAKSSRFHILWPLPTFPAHSHASLLQPDWSDFLYYPACHIHSAHPPFLQTVNSEVSLEIKEDFQLKYEELKDVS